MVRPTRTRAADGLLVGHPATCERCRVRLEGAAETAERNRLRPDEPVERGDLAYAGLLSPIGFIWIAAHAGHVVAIESNVDEVRFVLDVERRVGRSPRYSREAMQPILTQLGQYFDGSRRAFDLPLALHGLSPFAERVLRAVAAVPWGEVRSYGDIARAAGSPGAARAVGTVMATNPVSLVIPCHRVVRADGSAGEYGFRSLGPCGTAIKRQLLRHEGLELPPS